MPSVIATSSCSNLLVNRTDASGIIFSNKNGVYNNHMNCHWNLSSNTNLKLVFFRFRTEARYDFVYVYDGGSASSTPVGNFNGTSRPAVVSSSHNKLFIRFTSDVSIQHGGFAAGYHGKQLVKNVTSKRAVQYSEVRQELDRAKCMCVCRFNEIYLFCLLK